VAVSLALCFIAGEGMVRIFFAPEVSREFLERNVQADTGVKKLIRPHNDPDIYYELVPDMTAVFKGRTVKTDTRGARIGARRGEEDSERSPKALIVGLGDSTMFGWGVNQRNTYLQKLEDRINAWKGEASFEVLNFAVPGYNSEQELAVFHKKILRMKPAILILHYDHNDSDAIGEDYLPDYIAPDVGDNILHSALIKWVSRRVAVARNKNRIFVKGEHKRFQDYIIEGPSYDRHLQALAQLAGLAKTNKIPVYLVLFDAWIQFAPDRATDRHYQVLHRELVHFLKEQGFMVLDFYDLFQEYMKENGLKDLKSLWISPIDGHPNKKGHEIIAEALYRRLIQEPRVLELSAGGR
jgi:lysophospholipase L1-like esterase